MHVTQSLLHGLHIGPLNLNQMIQKKTTQQRIDDAENSSNLMEDCIKAAFFVTIIVIIYLQITHHDT